MLAFGAGIEKKELSPGVGYLSETGVANDIAEKEERLKRQLDFCLEIDKEKTIVRETYLADESRKETDAEHAWHMAVMAMVLSEYANKKSTPAAMIQSS